MLLLDEFYLESTDQISKIDTSYYPILFNVISLVKECILANVIGGQFNQAGHIHTTFIPNFAVEPLNILFRSECHISRFSNLVIHEFKRISRTTAKVIGCSVSSQTSIPYHTYTSHGDLQQSLRRFFTPTFDKADRKAIVFTDRVDTEELRQILNHFVDSVTFEKPSVSFVEASFTGCQYPSVSVIVDKLLPQNEDSENRKAFSLLNLALSRAESEAFVFAHESEKDHVKHFMELGNPSWVEDEEAQRYRHLLAEALNQQPIDLTFLSSKKTLNKTDQDFVQKLIRISVQLENKSLLETLIKKIGVNNMRVEQILFSLDHRRSEDFLNFLANKFKFQNTIIRAIENADHPLVKEYLSKAFGTNKITGFEIFDFKFGFGDSQLCLFQIPWK